MTDSVFPDNTPGTANDIGAVAFPGSGVSNTTNNVRETGSVGNPPTVGDDPVQFSFLPDPQGLLAPDPMDYYTFEPIDLATVSVDFTPLGIGERIGLVAVIPISGVSAVDGAIISLVSGGDLTLDPTLDYSFSDIEETLVGPAEFLLDQLKNPFLFPLVPGDFSEATILVDRDPIEGTKWTLTGEEVTFAVFGAELTLLDDPDPDDGGFGGGGIPTTDTFGDPEFQIDQVDYRIFLSPATGIDPVPPGTGGGGGGTPTTGGGGGTPTTGGGGGTPTTGGGGGGGTPTTGGGGGTPVGPIGGIAPTIDLALTPAGGGGTQPLMGERLIDQLLESEVLTGTGNFDVLTTIGPMSDFTLTWNADGSVNLADSVFPDADDTLIGFERIQFSDGVIALDVNGNAGQAYRLYQAAFAREPDTEGLIFWIDNLDEGNVDLIRTAELFVSSQEFVDRYGTPETVSNTDFLNLLYTNVLGRVSDQGGFDFWLDILNGGSFSRHQVLAEFSESAENQDNVRASIENGIVLPGYDIFF